jgi:hypothetical protein
MRLIAKQSIENVVQKDMDMMELLDEAAYRVGANICMPIQFDRVKVEASLQLHSTGQFNILAGAGPNTRKYQSMTGIPLSMVDWFGDFLGMRMKCRSNSFSCYPDNLKSQFWGGLATTDDDDWDDDSIINQGTVDDDEGGRRDEIIVVDDIEADQRDDCIILGDDDFMIIEDA